MQNDMRVKQREEKKRVDNPCKYCNKVNIGFVDDCEYGCDNPCEKAKDFWKELSNKLDDLLDKAQQLLRKEDEGNDN